MVQLRFLANRSTLRRVGLATTACAVLGLIYGFLAPRWYRSVLTVVPAKSQKMDGLSSLLGAGTLASGFLEGSGGSGADATRIAAVLQSVSVSDAVIGKFGLLERYKEKYQETAREALWRHCEVKVLAKPGLVQLSCEDTDPRFVQQLLSYFAEYGNQVFRRVSGNSASEEVHFLETRVTELRREADEAGQRMREFQEKYKIVDLDSQAKAVVSALSALNSQRISKQLELDYARTFSARDEPTLQQLESQLSIMGRKVRSLEQTDNDGTTSLGSQAQVEPRLAGLKGGLFPAALEVPKLRAEFEALYRDRKVAEASLIFTLERLEGARANEARDVSTFLVLDPPALPTRHSRPKKVIGIAVAALLGLMAAVAYEYVRSRGGIRAWLDGLQTGTQPSSSRLRDTAG